MPLGNHISRCRATITVLVVRSSYFGILSTLLTQLLGDLGDRQPEMNSQLYPYRMDCLLWPRIDNSWDVFGTHDH